MNHYEIAVFIGSLRRHSTNRRLADTFSSLAPSEFSFRQVEMASLPHYNEDDEDDPGDSVKALKAAIVQADGLIFVTPEYNCSIPGFLKNAIDHASRPQGQNVWAGKPAGILGASIGPVGTALAQQHLRNILGYLDVPTFSRAEAMVHVSDGFFDDAGNFASTDSRRILLDWMNEFTLWVKKHSAGRN